MEASAQIDIPTWNLLFGVLVPLIVSVITKKISSQGLKAVVNLGVSAVTGAGGAVIANGGHIPDVKAFIYGIAMTWGSSILSYYGLHKPTGLSDSVAEKTKNIGIGTPPGPTMETEDKGATAEGEAVADLLTDAKTQGQTFFIDGGATQAPGYGTFTVTGGPQNVGVNMESLNSNVGENATVTFATTGGAPVGSLGDDPTTPDIEECGSPYHGEYCYLPVHGPEVKHLRRPR